MADHHGHDGHDAHHGLPPPEPENIAISAVLIWGGMSFIFVIVAIMLVGSYFWVERLAEDEVKVGKYGAHQEKIKLLHAAEAQALHGYRNLGDGRYQVPIDRAMELMVQDYQKRSVPARVAPPVVPVVPADVPVVPVVPADAPVVPLVAPMSVAPISVAPTSGAE